MNHVSGAAQDSMSSTVQSININAHVDVDKNSINIYQIGIQTEIPSDDCHINISREEYLLLLEELKECRQENQ